MSDRMRPIPILTLLEGLFAEYRSEGTVLAVAPAFRGNPKKVLRVPGGRVETPFGPAAGPHTQLAQNIVAAYVGGARFFELKTVQTLDGADLPVSKPCILAQDEGYNVEWSTELTVAQALDEYVKAWFLLKLLSRELGLGGEDGFVFNMSVGYDLAGIRSPKIDSFIEGLRNAAALPVWEDCQEAARSLLPQFHNVDKAFLNAMDPRVCSAVTLSTLHGCPPAEIEAIASYLLAEKGLHTYVKLNPTLLGYDAARGILNQLGYEHISFDRRHFDADLQYDDAVPMLRRLMALAQERALSFGVKLTNTFPVEITAQELPGQEMYLSGKALYPLTLALSNRLSNTFEGELPMSWSGGADAFTIGPLFAAGLRPITLATTLLKPGGYRRLTQIAKILSAMPYDSGQRVSPDALSALAREAARDPYLKTSAKPLSGRKLAEQVPLLDCFTAPCKGGCPIGQDVPEYLRLLGEGRKAEALRVILDKNPLPHITGSLCAHPCMGKCTRSFYESPVRIREAKLAAAEGGWEVVLPQIKPLGRHTDVKAAIVGGGPAGMAAAFFLARSGASVTLFEQRSALGGVVRHVIPAFRIAEDAIEDDAALLKQLGVDIRLGAPAPQKDALFAQGYTHILLATGAWLPGRLPLAGTPPVNALAFLEKLRRGERPEARQVVVIGGGNTAMDAARAARRIPGVESVTLAYRRTKRYMPAEPEELELALGDGVVFRELLSPTGWDGKTLTCSVLTLGEADASGRRAPVETGQHTSLPADLVLSAVGEGVDIDVLAAYGLGADARVLVAGDAKKGPATVVEAIADATAAVHAILGESPVTHRPLPAGRRGEAMSKKGVLQDFRSPRREHERCLECQTLCENCVGVCPNRANVAVVVPTRKMPQIVHVDGLCNQCGNCETFCPYASAPYRDKFTVFGSVADFQDSENTGFVLLDADEHLVRVRLDGVTVETVLSGEDSPIPSGVQELMETVISEYPHLLY